MNKIIKKTSAFLLAGIMILLSLVVSYAEEQTKEIFNINENTNMMIAVEYTDGAPSVKFISPYGDEYGEEAISEGKMRVEDHGNALVYWIPNASAGQWSMVYDKGANPKLSITWAPYVESVSISEFYFKPNDQRSDRLDVYLAVGYVFDDWCNYKIYAVITDENGFVEGKKELRSSDIRANQEISEFTVDIGELATHDTYKLMAEVCAPGESLVTASVISENTFSYVNENAPEAIENVYLEICADDEYMVIDWSNYSRYCEKYLVAVYVDDNEEAFYFNEFDSEITRTEIVIDTTASKIKVQLGYIDRYGVVADMLTREIDMAYSKMVTLEKREASSSSQLKIDYDFSSLSESVKTIVEVNEQSQELLLKDAGSLTALLELFENDVWVYWYLDENTVFAAHSSVYYDNIAPVLVLPEIVSNTKTNVQNYILVGHTDAGCTLTINGEKIEIDETGAFKTTLTLNPGENEFNVISENALGNSSSQTFTVTYETQEIVKGDGVEKTEKESKVLSFFKKYYIMIFTFAASIILLAYVFICRNAVKKRIVKKGKASAIFFTVGTMLCYIAFLSAVFMSLNIYKYASASKALNSMDFYESASESALDAYLQIEELPVLKSDMISSCIVFGVIVVITVIAFVISQIYGKKYKAKESKQTTVDSDFCEKDNAKETGESASEKDDDSDDDGPINFV